MKKLTAFICAFAMIISCAACGAKPAAPAAPAAPAPSAAPAPVPASSEAAPAASEPEKKADPVDVRIAALKGPTAMGMVKFMDEVDGGNVKTNNYSFSIVGAVDEVTPKLVKGEVDIAAVPANLASVLYNNTKGQIQVLAVNTLGVIYIVESGDTVKSVEDLRGKTIYASGKGATPEYSLNHILKESGIDPVNDVTIEWKSEHAECLAALMANENAIAMLPQPFVTTAQTKNDKIRIALDLTEEWDKLLKDGDDSMLITGVVVGRKAFIDENPEAVADFLDNYSASVKFVNENTEQAGELIGKYEIVPAPVAKKALPYCNITFIEGAELKDALSGYLKVLFEQNPKAVGGAMPADDFYFAR